MVRLRRSLRKELLTRSWSTWKLLIATTRSFGASNGARWTNSLKQHVLYLKRILEENNEIIQIWSIGDNIDGVVRDRVPDITATLNRNLYQTFSCVDHSLQLVITDGSIDWKLQTHKKIKKVVECSAQCSKLLNGVQLHLGVPVHPMVKDEPNHWNSTYYVEEALGAKQLNLTFMSQCWSQSCNWNDFRWLEDHEVAILSFQTLKRQLHSD